ncbi:MAG: hypothetical protein MHM6MM_002446 [Cercozoa sp. M6MM]
MGIATALGYLAPILLYDAFGTRRRMETEAPSMRMLVMQVASSVWAYDFIFFWIHLMMHYDHFLSAKEVPQFLRPIVRHLRQWHLRHHTVSPVDATETVRHSFADAALQVLVNVAVLNAFKLHALSRIVHNVAVTYLLCDAHSGYNLPWQPHKVVPWVFGGSRRHFQHHLRKGRVYYAQFSCYLDDGVVPWIHGKLASRFKERTKRKF